MAVHLLFLMLFLYGSTAAPPLLQPPADCTKKCGNVTIPFPFGIEQGCFLNDWYEIECRQNGTIPRLKKIDLEVLTISLPHYPENYTETGASSSGLIGVNLPIIPSDGNCTSNKTKNQVLKNLLGSPLFYSADNLFVVLGCDQFVVINNANYSVLRGCKPYCNGRSFSRYSNCSGTDGCCRADLLALQESRVHFLKETQEKEDGQECSYAFLANHTWLELEMQRHGGSVDLLGIVSEGYVPGILNWGIFENDLVQEIAASSSVSCYTVFNNTDRPIRECICDPGHRGDPYLVNGCEVTKECKDRPEMCRLNSATVVVTSGDNGKILKQGMIGMGSGIGTILLLLFAWKSYDVTKKRAETKRKLKNFERNGGVLLQQQLSSPAGAMVEKSKLFSCTELEKATDNFNKDRILGEGGQGTVYKGMLSDGSIVAIKKSKAIDAGKVDMFINEVVILSQINHRNVVKLLGFCLESEIPLLVYEFIPNGTLYKFLHEPNEELPASWDTRLRLAKEVAGALSYLHSAASIPIYHRDIKSTNILLDDKYRAKVADFGTSRSVSLDQTHVTTMVQGTFGYLDPQYFQSNQFTDKSDVYSFGVVLVELLTGQKAVCSVLAQEGMGLASYFMVCMEEKKLLDILDPQVLSELKVKKEEIETVAYLAKRCLNLNGKRRPAMKEVAAILEGLGKAGNGGNELSRCCSYSEASETDDDMPESNVNACASSSSMSDVDPLIYGQTR